MERNEKLNNLLGEIKTRKNKIRYCELCNTPTTKKLYPVKEDPLVLEHINVCEDCLWSLSETEYTVAMGLLS